MSNDTMIDEFIVYQEKRNAWLHAHDIAETDVFSDERGEYVLVDDENGTAGEDGYSIRREKVYIKDVI